MSDERFLTIETMLAHHEEQMQVLSDTVVKQWKEIDILKKRLDRALEQVAQLEDTVDKGKGDEGASVSDIAARDKPPHY